ncbi:MAG: tetratricopeptide repeat protein [Acidobacteriota bacterium]
MRSHRPPTLLRGACLAAVAWCGLIVTAWGQDLRPVPPPALDDVGPDVRRQIEGAQAAVETARSAGGAELGKRYGQVGRLFLHYGFHAAAEPAFANAASLDGQDLSWTYFLAVTQQKRGFLETAAATLRRVLSTREGNLPAVLRLADLMLELGQSEEAEQLYRAALQSPLGVAAGQAGLGQIARDAGDGAAAVGHFQAALEAQPQATALKYRLGLAHREAGNLDRARDLLAERGGQDVRYPDPLMIQLGLDFESAGGQSAAGGRAAERGDLDSAIESYRRALEQRPGDLETRRALAASLAGQGDLEGASAEYREILERDAGNATAHLELGNLAIRGSNDPAAGVEHFRRAVAAAPTFADAHRQLARALGAAGQPDEALTHFERLVELDPRDPSARLLLATALMDAQKLDRALTTVSGLLEQEPGNLDGVVLRGRLLAAQGNVEGARSDFGRVAAAGSATLEQRAQAHFNTALLHQAAGDPQGAVESYRNALALDANHRQSLFNLATILASNNQLDGARDLYQRLFDLDPQNLESRYRLAVTLMKRGDHWPALGHFEALHQARPQALEFVISSALLLAEVGQGDQAAERLLESISKTEEPAVKGRLYMHLGAVEAKLGNAERGFGHYRRAAELAPEAPAVRKGYAEALGRAKRYRQAAEQYAAYVDLVPNDDGAQFAYAMTYVLDGRWAEARDALTKVTSSSTNLELTHLLARILSSAPDDAVRDGERAVAVAEAVFGAQRNPVHGETLAMAFAAAGRWDEAVALQERLLRESKAADFDAGFIARVESNLGRYGNRQVALSNW